MPEDDALVDAFLEGIIEEQPARALRSAFARSGSSRLLGH
jgi:hypothetical protein